jgi:small subunit ribosomal protein S17
MADESKTPEDDTKPEEATTSDAPPEPEAADEVQPDASASEAETSSDDTPVSEPEAASPEVLTPKQRRQRDRGAKAAAVPARPARTAEERQAERDAERKRKGQLRSARRKREREKARAGRGATPEPIAARREQHPGKQKTRQGVVVSDKATKTIVVRIDVTRRHPFYQKVVRTSTTLHAHDEREDAHVGDTVVVRESRPLSRTKRWRLVDVLERAK